MDDEDLIREQMEETRTSLTDKLETLENKVVSTVEGASDNVTDAVESVTDTVQETVAAVKEGVREGVDAVQQMFDCKQHFQNHPWLMLGGSIAAGFVLAEFLSRGRPTVEASRASLSPGRGGTAQRSHQGNGHQGTRAGKHAAVAAPAQSPGAFSEEWKKLKGLAIGALLGTLREVVVKSLPPDLGPQLTEIVDSFTRKMGGEPVPEKVAEEAEPWQRHAS